MLPTSLIIIIIALLHTGFCDECSDVTDISKCLSTSNFCYIVEANVPYVSKNQTDGVVQDKVNDVCRSLNYFTPCEQIVTKQSCQLGSCLWDPIDENCYEWDAAPCSSYPNAICQWNPSCQLDNQTLTLDLSTNYTLMNSIDQNQFDGRLPGTWLYEFGLIISVTDKQQNQETYLFTKCQLKNTCKLIQIYDLSQATFICQNTDMDCYYSSDSGSCETISHQSKCSDITWQTKCESGAAPCIWLSTRCAPYDDPKVSCYILGATRCLNNEDCYLEGNTCKPYLQCEDFITKEQCDSTPIYHCYYDDYYGTCKILTSNVQCKNIGSEINCKVFPGKCLWDTATSLCQDILQDFYCQQFVETKCPDKGTDAIPATAGTPAIPAVPGDQKTQMCLWNINYQLCMWNYSTDCIIRTIDTCDSSANINNSCYYDKVLNVCSPIQPNTKCELLGQYACSFSTIQNQNYCQWSKQRSLCLSIFDMKCEDLQSNFCNYREKCFKNGNSCSSRKQCQDYTQISDCQDDTTLVCYYDYSLLQCRRVTTQTKCNQIFREISCSQAICAWKNGTCQELEEVSCSDLTIQNCKYSSDCYYYDSECIPLDACQLNDGNEAACIQDNHHCYYSSDTNKCIQIDGNSACSNVIGADNCNYAACVLQPGANKKLQCLEYFDADCSYLKQQYCNFGQCTWNTTIATCVSYPPVQKIVIIDNSTTTNNTNVSNTTVDNSTVNFGLYLVAVSYLALSYI